jgi:hypothetical protein
VRCSAGADPRLSAWGTALELAGLGLQVREPRVPYDGQIRSDFKMQRFESCRLELRVLAIPILECRCSNPAASASQSVSNASHMKVAQKSRGTARFRRYELVSVWGIWQWRRHSCLLSPRALFGVSFLMCALPGQTWRADRLPQEIHMSGTSFCTSTASSLSSWCRANASSRLVRVAPRSAPLDRAFQQSRGSRILRKALLLLQERQAAQYDCEQVVEVMRHTAGQLTVLCAGGPAPRLPVPTVGALAHSKQHSFGRLRGAPCCRGRLLLREHCQCAMDDSGNNGADNRGDHVEPDICEVIGRDHRT